jgi:hypothetical protein
MAAILQLRHGDPLFGVRVAAKAYQLVREQAVMLAPVTVLHLPDPGGLADECFGPERAAALLAEAAPIPMADVIAEILSAPAPAAGPAPVEARVGPDAS